jgi:hypothetical protein
MTVPVLRPLSSGEVLDVSFGLYRSNFFTLIVVSLACQSIPQILSIYLQASGGILAHPLLWLVQVFTGMTLSALAVAATTAIVAGAYLDQVVSPGVALRQAGSLLGRVVVISILSSLAIGLGFLLLIIPGFIAAAGLALSSCVLVVERLPSASAAMKRSWDLTRGFRGKVMLVLFVASLTLTLPGIVLGVFVLIKSGVAAGSKPLWLLVGSAALTMLVYPFLYTAITVLYYDLRVRKEGYDLELLATAMPGPA